MPEFQLNNTEPAQLAELLSVDPNVGANWQPEELAAILRHQLDARLDYDLSELGTEYAQITLSPDAGRERGEVTFGELLNHARPALSLLERAKRFAKACKSHPHGPLPTEVATVLYFACIAVAHLRCAKRISALNDESLMIGVRWALAQNWLDVQTRGLFQEMMDAFDRPASGGSREDPIAR